MSTTEDKLQGTTSPVETPDVETQDGEPRLPLAAYVPMGATSRYTKPKATIDPDRTKSWIKRATPIVMAHKLGLRVVAEGVETAAQSGLLAMAGCDFAQGYVYAGALPPPELTTLAKRGLSLLH